MQKTKQNTLVLGTTQAGYGIHYLKIKYLLKNKILELHWWYSQ